MFLFSFFLLAVADLCFVMLTCMLLLLIMVVVSLGLFKGLLVGMSLGLLVLVIEGTLGSEAMFCSSDWLSGWI